MVAAEVFEVVPLEPMTALKGVSDTVCFIRLQSRFYEPTLFWSQ